MNVPKTPEAAELRVVIVDDNPVNLELLRDSLELEGIAVGSFLSGRAAMEHLRCALPDVIVLDLHMPEVSGTDILRWLKESFGDAAPPAVILSADQTEGSVSEAFESGAFDYMCKPFRRGELVAKIRHLARQARRDRPTLALSALRPGFNGFEVVKELGRGGMGIVHEVRSPDHPGRRLALKQHVVQGPGSDIAAMRFRREIELLLRLEHPRIARIVDFGHTQDSVYYVMELVDGDSLDKLLDKAQPLPPREVAHILDQALDALGFLHENGVLHRDIKPDNIIRRPDGSITLIDFGLARTLDDARLTRASRLLGTPGYMAPEQIQGEDTDGRSDLFSVGLVALDLLLGRSAIADRNPYVCLNRILTGRFPRARQVEGAPPALAAIIDGLTALDPAARTPDAAAARAALRPLLVARA